jgi:CheY-like chemotaxis protein
MEPRTDQHSARRAILVVDGDVQIRRLLELSLRNAGFDVRAVATATEALSAVGDQRPDLIVSDARLDGGPDGFELCRQIKKRTDGRSIAFVFLAEQTVETKLRGVEAGADDFLAKPVYVQEVVAHARSLLQRRERDRLEALARGDEKFIAGLDDFPLVDLLGALEANHKSGVVVLSSPAGTRGEIYFREGRVVDAEVGRLSGLDAVCRLFSWSQGRFEIEWKSIRRKDAVGKEPSALVMEALRRLDEWRRLLSEVPALETVFEVDYHLLAERLAEIPDEVNGVLRLFDGQRSFMQVIDDCGLPDLDALAVIGKLYREHIIHDVRSRPDSVSTPGADIEGWLTEAAGPFRMPAMLPRRELFGPASEPAPSVHGRATAPIEPLEELGREAIVEERRERFTDRLIAEGASASTPEPAPPAPALAPETTQLGVPAPPAPALAPETTQLGVPAPPRVPVLAPETTQLGLGQPVPALSTRPGFAAVTPAMVPPPRAAREMPDVTPSSRATPLGLAPLGLPGDGVPQPVLPQSAAPAIVIPPPSGQPSAPAESIAEPAAVEQRPVAGEIVARTPTAKLFEAKAAVIPAGATKRTTDLGFPAEGQDETKAKAQAKSEAKAGAEPNRESGAKLQAEPKGDAEAKHEAETEPNADDAAPRAAEAPAEASPSGDKSDPRAFAPTAAAGEVIAVPAKAPEIRPAKKIILDADVAEELPRATPPRWGRIALFTAGFGGAIGLLFFVFASSGHKKKEKAEDTVAGVIGPQQPVGQPIAPPTTAAAPDAGAAAPDAGAPAVASSDDGAAPGHAGGTHSAAPRHAPHVSPAADVEERMADPKVSRAVTTEAPQLLAACRQAFTEKRAKDAETACIAAKDANPNSPEACALLGHALFNRKKRREALQWAERAIELDPRHADAYVIIGGVKQAADDPAAAKAAYKKYLELAPNGQYAADLRAIVDSL